MKEFVSNRRVSIVASVTALLILWGVIAVPGGPAFPGVVSLTVLAVLLITTARLVFAGAPSASMSDVIQGVEGESRRVPVPVTVAPMPLRH